MSRKICKIGKYPNPNKSCGEAYFYGEYCEFVIQLSFNCSVHRYMHTQSQNKSSKFLAFHIQKFELLFLVGNTRST